MTEDRTMRLARGRLRDDKAAYEWNRKNIKKAGRFDFQKRLKHRVEVLEWLISTSEEIEREMSELEKKEEGPSVAPMTNLV